MWAEKIKRLLKIAQYLSLLLIALTILVTAAPELLQKVNAHNTELSEGLSADKNDLVFSDNEVNESDVIIEPIKLVLIKFIYPTKHNIALCKDINGPIISRYTPPPQS